MSALSREEIARDIFCIERWGYEADSDAQRQLRFAEWAGHPDADILDPDCPEWDPHTVEHGREYYRKLVDYILSRLPVGEDWRPIETAPKDGARLLLICASAYSPEARMGWWRSDAWVGLMPGGEKDPGGLTIWFPTHWRPLPPPPASTGEG